MSHHLIPGKESANFYMSKINIKWLAVYHNYCQPLLIFIIKRILHMVPILFCVVAIGFLLIQIAPGDILSDMRLNPDIKPETLERFIERFGLNDPWYVQLIKYIRNIFRGDFGFSESFKAPVFKIINRLAPNTLLLAFVSLLVAWGLSIPAGIISAVYQYKWQDQLISFIAFIGLSIPNFFLAFLLIYTVTATGAWLPIGGMQSVNFSNLNWFEKILDVLKHLIIPVIVLSTSAMAQLTRIMRANMLEVLNQPYIKTARAKGLKEQLVISQHALKNAINPMITIFGFQFGALLSGAALTEAVLSWPGLGKLILNATISQDLYLVVGSLIYSVILIMLGNLLADILLVIIDPRIRMGK